MKRILFYLIQKALKALLDKSAKAVLPKIYEKLDTRIPVALFNGASSKVVEAEIKYTIEQVIGKPVAQETVDLVTALYNPIKNAERIQRLPK